MVTRFASKWRGDAGEGKTRSDGGGRFGGKRRPPCPLSRLIDALLRNGRERGALPYLGRTWRTPGMQGESDRGTPRRAPVGSRIDVRRVLC